MSKIKLIVSACLLGEPVRYDGKAKADHYVREMLGGAFELIAVCPETEAGLAVPREAMRLTGDPAAPQMLGVVSGRDFTGELRHWLARRLPELAAMEPDGFVLKSNSPSCGLSPVAVSGAAVPGAGILAGCVAAGFPELAVTSEKMLANRFGRQRFLDKLLVMHCWRELLKAGAVPERLLEFHRNLRLLAMSHAPGRTGELDKSARRGDWGVYERKLAVILDAWPEQSKHDNVWRHLQCALARHLSEPEKKALNRSLEAFADGELSAVAMIMQFKLLCEALEPDEYGAQFYWQLAGPLY